MRARNRISDVARRLPACAASLEKEKEYAATDPTRSRVWVSRVRNCGLALRGHASRALSKGEAARLGPRLDGRNEGSGRARRGSGTAGKRGGALGSPSGGGVLPRCVSGGDGAAGRGPRGI